MCDENIEIGVTEITNNILVSATPTDQIIDINVLEEVENVELTITPSVVEVNIDVTQELITEVVTIDANTCVNIIDVTVTDATDNVVLNITPSLVEVNINRGQNNLSIEEYDTFADLPTIGDTDTYYITLDDNKFWRWDAINEVYVEISDSDDKVPYLGATGNVNLGEWGIKAGWFGFDTTPTNTPTAVGTMSWNDTDGTADLKLKGGNVTLQIGQESVVRVVNKTGATLNEADFRAVRVRSVAEGGAQGQRLAVLLAQADSDADSATTIGLVTESISNNQEGFITIVGDVKEINTTGAKSYGGAETWVDGDILYLSPTHAGYLTNVKPSAPNHLVIVGYVVYAHANHGKIFVKVDNGYELDELHNVHITTPTNGQSLIYDSALGYWKNGAATLSLTANSPLSIASNVISISQANATTDGYVSSTDWNYFSAKQSALSGTGFVKISGSTISYDNTTYTPQGRTLTINGTSYDLSADRSWSISVGSGMRNVSSFVATAGQTTFTITGGYTAGLVDVYVNGARLNASDYTASNGTTVVLGTGLVANDIVDIINYVASLTSGLTGAGTTNYIPKWSSSSNLTNSLLFDNGTNIGLGTITPDSLLHIYYNSAGTTFNDIAHIGAGAGKSLFIGTNAYGFSLNDSASRAGWGIDTDSDSGFMRFYYGASEKIRLKFNGNLGIGLTNPSYKLDVAGDINITGTYYVNGVAINSGTVTSISALTIGTTGTDITSSVANSTTTPVITLNIPTASATNRGALSSADWTTFNSKQAALTNPVTGTGTSGYLAKWNGTTTINSSIIYDNGTNVGIGTTSPTAMGAYKILEVQNATGGIIRYTNTSAQGGYIAGNSGGLTYDTLGAFPHIFYTNGSTRMTIANSGNVGIGTSSPSRRLDVASDGSNWISGTFSGTGNTDKVVIGNLAMPTIGGHNSALNAWSDFMISGVNVIFANYGAEKARLISDGTFAIGTTTRANVWGLLTLRNTLNAAGSKWGIGPDTNNSLTVYNPSNVGVYIVDGGVAWIANSDERLKTDLVPIQNAINKVSLLRSVIGRYKTDEIGTKRAFLIAQDVLKVLPEAVTNNNTTGYLGVSYSEIIPLLVASIKELNAKIELLEAK